MIIEADSESISTSKSSVVFASERLRRGTKTEDYLTAISNDSTIVSAIESPFQVQEYLTHLVAEDPHNVPRLVELPRWRSNDSVDTKGKAREEKQSQNESENDESEAGNGNENEKENQNDNDTREAKIEENVESVNGTQDGQDDGQVYVERDIWLYEHLRRLAMDLSHPFVVTLQEHCSRETCPEMKAGEWLYLCAAHATANETECCAIDYITHTLEGATALLNSSRYFPSRLSIPTTSLKHFTSIARRLYRIFAHAWFHHREVFDICEAETSLYERFLALSHEYELVSPDLLVIPFVGVKNGGSSSSSSSGDDGEEEEEEEEINPRD